MLRAVFIGSANPFNEILVDWLSRRTYLVGVVWTKSTAWQRTWRGRFRFLRRRLRRYGMVKVLDEVLLFFLYHTFLAKRDLEDLRREVIRPYHQRHGVPKWRGDGILAHNVNAPEVVAFLEERAPDVAFAMCISDYFGRRIRAIPKQGVFLWHEGITPEYKGLYAPFWAVHNLDFEAIGYTLLRMNDAIDGGAVYVQGPAHGVDPFRHYHAYLGHKAIMDSLPAVEQFLRDLESGTAQAIWRRGGREGTYTYPGLSDFLRQRWRLRRAAWRGSAIAS